MRICVLFSLILFTAQSWANENCREALSELSTETMTVIAQIAEAELQIEESAITGQLSLANRLSFAEDVTRLKKDLVSSSNIKNLDELVARAKADLAKSLSNEKPVPTAAPHQLPASETYLVNQYEFKHETRLCTPYIQYPKFSPSGRYLAYTDCLDHLHIYDTDLAKETIMIESSSIGDKVLDIAFHPTRDEIVILTNKNTTIWSLHNGIKMRTVEDFLFQNMWNRTLVLLLKSAKHLARAYYRAVIWQSATKSIITSYGNKIYIRDEKSNIENALIGLSTKKVLHYKEGPVFTMDIAATGRKILTTHIEFEKTDMTWSKAALITDTHSGTTTARLVHESPVTSAQFVDEREKQILTITDSDNNYSAHIWQIGTTGKYELVKSLKLPYSVLSYSINPNSKEAVFKLFDIATLKENNLALIWNFAGQNNFTVNIQNVSKDAIALKITEAGQLYIATEIGLQIWKKTVPDTEKEDKP